MDAAVAADSVPLSLVLKILPPSLDLRRVSHVEGFDGKTKRLRDLAEQKRFPRIRRVGKATWEVPTAEYIAWRLAQDGAA